MDQHPIPQDVTGFQFKLIGTMTVKQFGYVAAGAIMAVVLYYLPLNSAFGVLVKVFLIPLLGASGVVIAFVPVDGRPIDVMTTNFVKALFSPNQYIYRRQGRKMSFSTVSVMKPTTAQKDAKTSSTQTHPVSPSDQKQEKLRAFLVNSQGGVKNELDKKEASFLKSFAPIAPIATTTPTTSAPKFVTQTVKQVAPLNAVKPITQPTSQLNLATPSVQPVTAAPSVAPQPHSIGQSPIQNTAPTPIVPPSPNETAETLEKKEQLLAQELARAKQEETQSLVPAAHQKVETLAKQIEQIHSQKVLLEQELNKLQSQLSEQKNVAPTVAPAPAPAPIKASIPIQDPKLVKVVQKEATIKKSDAPSVSDTPNVVVGIVKDPRGNVLSNILVEVKDKTGNPVRAFKTNPLGQFASATPLSPGVYTMELEDPKGKQNFDLIQITANNEIMHPIEIISHDAREALRQQLFS